LQKGNIGRRVKKMTQEGFLAGDRKPGLSPNCNVPSKSNYSILLWDMMNTFRKKRLRPTSCGRQLGQQQLRILFTCLLTLVMFTAASSATAGSEVIAWGAGTTINPSDGYDFGQSIVPANLTNAVEVAGGQWDSLALKADGTLVAWGDNSFGETDVPAGNNYVAIACGAAHNLALQSNGLVVAFGQDFFGQTDVPAGLSNVVAIACGFYHSVALQADGTVVAWGADTSIMPVGDNPNYGQTIVPAGLSNVVAIAAGGYHTFALRANGTLVEWGDENTIEIPAGLSNAVAIASGAEHNVVLMNSGNLSVWGTNTYGQTNIPVGLSNVVAIAAGSWHTLALQNNGTVAAWGAGIGSNTYVDYGQTIVPSGLSNVVQVAGGWYHSLALKAKGLPVLKAPLTANGFGTNGFSVSLPARNGRVYQLAYVNSLTNQIWTALPLQSGTGGLMELNDPAASSATQRFYQVRRW
jgi:hypothetical protein